MLPSDTPFLGYALALLASSFRPVTADLSFQAHAWNIGKCAMPGTRKYPPAKPGALVCEPLKAAITEPYGSLSPLKGAVSSY